MITHAPPARRRAALLTATAVLAGAFLLPATTAAAAPGPAPAPVEHRVIQDTHADAISTFVEDGALVMGSKADLPEGGGTRVDPEAVWYHVDDDSRTTAPAGVEFIAPEGSTIWLAPESNPGAGQLWPGFSTESVPGGAVDGDQTTFTLTAVDGPGDLELFTRDAFGGTKRLWSSDEDVKTFTVGRTHMHANWAFTAPGTYRVTVGGAVTIGGAASSDTATYTFVVGSLPEQVATATTLTASAAHLVLGDPVTLTATVAPAEVEGWVEFRDGSTVLGHEAVVDGSAEHTVAQPVVGSHSYTAAFVPAVANLAVASSSSPVDVVVLEESGGEEFGLRGVAPSYVVGDQLDVRLVGVTLAEGQSVLWSIRPVGTTNSGYALDGTGSSAAAGRLEMPLDMSHDGFEIQALLRQGKTTVQRTAWVPLVVTQAGGQPTLTLETTGPYYSGEAVGLTVTGRDLGPGESFRLVQRNGSPWYVVEDAVVDGASIAMVGMQWHTGDWAVQVLRDGVVVAQSAVLPMTITDREVMLEGTQGVYRDGSILRATGTVYPEREGLVYEWSYSNYSVEPWVTTVIKEGAGPDALSLEWPITKDLHGGYVYLVAKLGDAYVGQASAPIYVSTADPDEQIFFFETIGGHYHQGGLISLGLIADPGLAEDDTVAWEWRWPGQDWTTLPGAEGLTHSLVAEQAMDGVEVRATLTFAGGGGSLPAEPVTILVDDHGSPARQKITIGGAGQPLPEGKEATLTATVAPATVVDRWEWFVQRAGESTPVRVEDEHGPQLRFAAASELDGAAVFARLVLPDGTVYVESAPVLLDVVAGAPDPEPEPTLPTDPEPAPTDPGTPPVPGDPEPVDPGPGVPAPPAPGTPTAPTPVPADPAPVTPVPVVPVPTTDPSGKPLTAPVARSGADLVGVAEGGAELGNRELRQGQVVTVDVGDDLAGTWVEAWLFDPAALLGGDWTRVAADGTVTVRIPESTPPGNHRLAIFDAQGAVVGWAAVTVAAADGTSPSGTLPQTGAGVGPLWIVLSLLLVTAGGALVAVRRRATRHQPEQ